MQTITQHLGIGGPTDFLNIYPERDNRLYVDPGAIRRAGSSAYKRDALALMDSHFNEVLRCIRSTVATDRAHGEALLQGYGEPKETRLGMSKVGSDGHGAAAKLGSDLWSQLVSNPLCRARVAVMKYVEDIPIFVSGLGSDITSDLTTRIIYEPLATFTADQVAKHPEFTAVNGPTLTSNYRCWDGPTNSWQEKPFSLPAFGGKPLLLVPKDWVHFRLVQNPTQYYNVPLLGQVREERTTYTVSAKGKRKAIRPKKKDLKAEPGLKYSRATNTKRTFQVKEEKDIDVLADYRSYVDGKHGALTDAEISRRLGD